MKQDSRHQEMKNNGVQEAENKWGELYAGPRLLPCQLPVAVQRRETQA